MICPNCSKENKEEAVVCEFYGYILDSKRSKLESYWKKMMY